MIFFLQKDYFKLKEESLEVLRYIYSGGDSSIVVEKRQKTLLTLAP